MGSIVALLKKIYEQKEKIILGILVVAFAGVAYIQLKKNDDPDNPRPGNSASLIGDFTPATPRQMVYVEVPNVGNKYSLETYYNVVAKRNIFRPPGQVDRGGKAEAPQWAQMKVKSVFDPTQSGSYIAVIDVDKRTRIVKEGQLFEGYEVRRIDGVRSCLTIYRRDIDQEKEFCKEE